MRKIPLTLSIALLIAVSIFAAPSTSQATSTTIDNVTVTVGNLTACISGCGSGNIWSTGAGTVLTSSDEAGPNKALILTQTAGFNFDTSDGFGGPSNPCNTAAGHTCLTSLNINGINIVLSGANANVLANNSGDPGGVPHNEAADWGVNVFNGGSGGLRVWFAYADNAHTDPCADVDSNCLPENPWQGSPNTVYVGAAGDGVGGCDRPGVVPCFDGGTIRIEVNPASATRQIIPEPSAMLLLGIGLIGLGAWARKPKLV